MMRDRSDRGVALIIVLLVMMLLSALGLSLTMVISTEERVADAYSSGSEAFYAADAALELAVQELSRVPEWSLVLDGTVTSTFINSRVGLQEWPGGETNNLRWRLFASGAVSEFSPTGTINSPGHVAVWVGDDLLENDGNPVVDGDDSAGTNPGRGMLSLLVHAYGPSSRRVIEATVAQAGNGVRVLSWREVR